MSAALTRRAALSGAVASVAMAGVAVAGAAAVSPVVSAGISPDLARLIEAAVNAERTYRVFYKANVSPAEARYFATRKAGADAAAINEAHGAYHAANERSEAMLRVSSDATQAVCFHPVATPADFQAKVAFMVANQMFEGFDWGAEMLADARRLAKMEAAA